MKELIGKRNYSKGYINIEKSPELKAEKTDPESHMKERRATQDSDL